MEYIVNPGGWEFTLEDTHGNVLFTLLTEDVIDEYFLADNDRNYEEFYQELLVKKYHEYLDDLEENDE